MWLLVETWRVLRDMARACAAWRQGRRVRFEHAVLIKAPRATVWQMLRSRDITFDGLVPMRVTTMAVPGRPDLEKGRIILGEREIILMTRTIEERPEKALLLEIVAEGSDPAVVMGGDDFIGFVLDEAPDGTLLSLTRELVPGRIGAILQVPVGLRSGAARYRKKAEAMATGVADAGRGGAGTGEPVGSAVPIAATTATTASAASVAPAKSSVFGLTRNGLALSLVALASFAWLWGLQQALLISGIIILHELGHAAAMLMVGIPVKGIYLVPFFGGAAVAAAPYSRESQIGFVALMGPAFSLLPTAALTVAAQQTGNADVLKAAELSGIINLLNLAPILPLDGGHVLKAALLSMNRTLALVAGLLGAGLGLWGAWVVADPLLGLFAGLGVMIALQMRKASLKTPMRWPAAAGLLLAMLATIAAYGFMLTLVYKQQAGI